MTGIDYTIITCFPVAGHLHLSRRESSSSRRYDKFLLSVEESANFPLPITGKHILTVICKLSVCLKFLLFLLRLTTSRHKLGHWEESQSNVRIYG